MPTTAQFDIILFDLGGVLIELSGVDRMLELCNHALSVDELWARWLASDGVRRFETGRASAEEFGAAMLAEFGLSIEAAQFLEEFTIWPKGVFPGSFDLLQQLSASYRLAWRVTSSLPSPRIWSACSSPILRSSGMWSSSWAFRPSASCSWTTTSSTSRAPNQPA